MKISTFVALLVAMTAISGCQTTKEATNLATLGVDFQFEKKHGCKRISPPFRISAIPAGTKYLEFAMTDLDYVTFNHGGGVVAYSGSGNIPEGALKSYRGPCPPEEHSYEMVVRALNDKKDLILGEGKATRNYCCR